MYVTTTKTKSSIIYYLNKTYRDPVTNKVSTMVVERIGSKTELQAKIGKNKNLDKWLKEYAAKKTAEEKNKEDISVTIGTKSYINKNQHRIFNGGYLAIRNLLHKVGLSEICKDIAKKEKLNYDLFQILTNMVSTQLLQGDASVETLSYSKTFIEQPKYTKRQFYNAITLFSKYDCYIQLALYEKANKLVNAKTEACYYQVGNFFHDFTNYQEDIETNKDKDLLINYELILNNYGLPLYYSIYNRNNEYKKEASELGDKIIETYKGGKIISLSSFTNYNLSVVASKNTPTSKYLKLININKLNDDLKDWIQNDEPWKEVYTQKTWDLDDVKSMLKDSSLDANKRNYYYYIRFYKTKIIDYYDPDLKEKTKKKIAVVYGKEVEDYHLSKRKNQIENIVHSINNELFKHYDDKDYCLNYLKKYEKYVDVNIPKFENDRLLNMYFIKNDFINNLNSFDGYYAIIMDEDIDEYPALTLQCTQWFTEHIFHTVYKDFYSVPKYVKYEDRMQTHFFISYISLLLLRLLLAFSDGKFTYIQLFRTFKDLNYLYIKKNGWIPVFDINELTPFAQKIIDKNITKEFISIDEMNEILSNTHIDF